MHWGTSCRNNITWLGSKWNTKPVSARHVEFLETSSKSRPKVARTIESDNYAFLARSKLRSVRAMAKKPVASRTDSNIEDDEAGAARVRMAAESAERKRAEEEARRQENAALARRLEKGPSRTDSNIEDDPAGIARKELAAASKARLEAERAARRKHQQEMERRIRETPPRTDNEMDTEAAAIARKVLADKSRAQKQAQEATRRRQNAELRRQLEATPPRIDDCIADEAAGARRHELALESARRREHEHRQRVYWNKHLKERVAAATDEDGCDEQKQAFQAAIAKHELEKGSEVSAMTWINFQRYMDAFMTAGESRAAKQNRDARRNDLRAQWLQYGHHLAVRRAEQMQINREVQEEMHQYNRDDAERVRQEEALRREVAETERSAYQGVVRERVRVARGLDDRLDELEEAQDALERMEGSQMRFASAEDLKVVREGGLALRRQHVQKMKEQVRQGLHDSCKQSAHEHAMRAQEKRNLSKQWSAEKSANEDEYLRNARAQKAAAAETRKKIKDSNEALIRRRQERAQQLRDEVDLDFEDALQNIKDRKAFIREAYSAKFVDAPEAEQYLRSPLHNLHTAAKRVLESVGHTLFSKSAPTSPLASPATAAAQAV